MSFAISNASFVQCSRMVAISEIHIFMFTIKTQLLVCCGHILKCIYVIKICYLLQQVAYYITSDILSKATTSMFK